MASLPSSMCSFRKRKHGSLEIEPLESHSYDEIVTNTLNTCFRNVSVITDLVYSYLAHPTTCSLSSQLSMPGLLMTPNLQSLTLIGVDIDLQLLIRCCRLRELKLKSIPNLCDDHIKQLVCRISLDTLQLSHMDLTDQAFDYLQQAKRITKLILDVSFLIKCVENTVYLAKEISPEDQQLFATYKRKNIHTPQQLLTMAEECEASHQSSTSELGKKIRQYLNYGIFLKLLKIPGLKTIQLIGWISQKNLNFFHQQMPNITLALSDYCIIHFMHEETFISSMDSN